MKYRLRPGFAFPFAGMQLTLDSTAANYSKFTKFHKLRVQIKHHANDSTLYRAWIHSRRKIHNTSVVAPNEVQYRPKSNWQNLSIDWIHLRLPSWWISQYRVPIEEQYARIDDVVSISFVTPDASSQTDSGTVEVSKVWMEGPIIARSKLLIGIQILWVVWAVGFLVQGWLAWMRRARQAEGVVPRVKTEFLATMSHEIRTPLNGMIVPAQLLQDTPLDSEQRGLVQTILESGNHLAAILQDALDYFKIETDKLTLEHVPFSVSQTVESVGRIFQSQASEKGLALRVEIDPLLPQAIQGDPLRLKQILINLVSNAVKFADSGEILLNASLVRHPDGLPGLDKIRFQVKDTGLGMSPEETRRLFQKFTQLDSSIARRFGGTGLGLSIAQGLAVKMGTSIEVESVVGKGSNFAFSISFEKAELERLSDPAISKETSSLGSTAILVVDDNRVNLRVATAALEKIGCQVRGASSGLEALSIMEQHAFNLVLMDCHMPEMDGFQTSLKIRSWVNDASEMRRQAASTPILALTADVLPDIRERCLEAKMDGVIPKPFRREQLAMEVQTWAKSVHQDDASA
jgi:signal transduction histidine kinase/AmiR/NasT family two-component response regulator